MTATVTNTGLLEVALVLDEQRFTGSVAEVDVVEIANRAYAAAGRSAPASIAVMLTTDSVLQDLNRRFRGRDKPTNVLSFPAAAGFGGGPAHLGDMAIAYETTAAEARALETPLPHHLAHLIVHGVLHLCGFDHMTRGDAERMEAIETRLLAGLGIADPYAPPHEHGRPPRAAELGHG